MFRILKKMKAQVLIANKGKKSKIQTKRLPKKKI